MTKPTHYLRFVQAVVLAAAVPACTASSEEPKPAPSSDTAQQADQKKTEESSKPEEQKTEEAKTEEPKAEPLDGTGKPADAGLPFSSGPLMPPTLPASFA